MNDEYEDILYEERPLSGMRAPMPRRQRAAQFAPFAALHGHGEAVAETGRLTDRALSPDDGEIEQIDRMLCRLSMQLPANVRVTYFEPDPRKEGGRYVTAPVCVRRVDTVAQVLCLQDRTEIPFARLLRVEFL